MLENDENFEEELTWCFKTVTRNWTNFGPSTQTSEKLALQWAPFDQGI